MAEIVAAMPNPTSYKISLRIRHPSIDPSEITRELLWPPERTCRKGDPRTTPKGDPLTGFYSDSYWYCQMYDDLNEETTPTLAVTIGKVLDTMAPHRDFFHRMRAEGGSIELFIGWFINGNGGDAFEYPLLARCVDLMVDLSFDVYG